MKEQNTLIPASLDFTNESLVKTLKNTVASGLSDPEFALFTEFCRSTGLNPFKKEIWAIKAGGKLQLMTGVNGFYEIANRHPQFDGMEVETIEERGQLVKCVARVYRKDRSRPMTAEAYWSEYHKEFGNWKTMPRVMLSKCAECMALRKSFPQELNGLYTQEEMPEQFEPRASIVEKPQPVEVFDPRFKDPATWRIEGSQIGKQSGKVKSIGKLVGEIERETLLKAIRDKRAQVMLSENDINAIIGYLAATEPKPEMEVVPIEEDEIPTTWSDPE